MSITLLRDVLFGVVLCLVGTDYINSANAQQTDQQTIVTKAETALAAKIKWRDFRKNANGTWTSGPNTKIGAYLFPNTPLTFVECGAVPDWHRSWYGNPLSGSRADCARS